MPAFPRALTPARHRIATAARRGALALAAAAVGSTLVATPATAAPLHEWDSLAQCESGGRWHINTGNGYHGGLQFSPRTWNAFGGQQFAQYAFQATREQQIVVAERVLAGQGWRAWPSCSRKLGLRGAADPVGAEARLLHPAPPAPPAPAPAPPAPPAPAHRTHTVAPGDTLYRIAVNNGVPGGFHQLHDLNRDVIGPNPAAIRVGQVLRLP